MKNYDELICKTMFVDEAIWTNYSVAMAINQHPYFIPLIEIIQKVSF